MKQTYFLIIGLLAIQGHVCLAPAGASPASYSYSLYYQTSEWGDTGGGSWGTFWLDGVGGAPPGYTGEPLCPFLSDPTAVIVSLYNVSGVNGWNGPTGFYYADIGSNLSYGQTRVLDNIYVWAGPSATGNRMALVQFGDFLSPGLNYQISLITVPTGVSYSGPLHWGFGATSNPTTINLPMYKTDDGTTGYRFQVELSTVPEPSSIVGLLSGFAVIGALALRRKLI